MAKYKIIPSSRTIVQSPISIGHKAEKGVEAIEFDLTAWVETYGSGTLTVIMRRWGDAIPYPIALEIDENNKATWTLSDIDTAKAGMAYAQLSYVVGDEVVKKSDIYTFRVMDSLTGEGEPPEAYESWLEHLTHIAAEAMAEVLDIEGIVTDKTLTVDGGIADAKATGEALAEKVDAADYSELSARVGANTIALAEKADRSTTYTKTEVDQMIEDVEVETDTTLEVEGAAADAAETGRQIGLLKADLGAYGAMDALLPNATFTSRTNNGVTFTWNSDNSECAVSGTSTGIAITNLYYSNTAMPDGIRAGEEYYVIFDTQDENCYLEILAFYDGGSYLQIIRENVIYTVPDGTIGIGVRLRVKSNSSVDLVVPRPRILTSLPNKKLAEDVDALLSAPLEDRLYNGVDVSRHFNFSSYRISNGYVFTWVNRNTCEIIGESTSSNAFANFLEYSELPSFMPEGSAFELKAQLPVGVCIEINFYAEDGTITNYRGRTSGVYKLIVPYGTHHMIARILIPTSSGSVNGTAYIYMRTIPCKGVLTKNDFVYNDKVTNGITFAWEADPTNPTLGIGKKCNVSGESTGLSFDVIYNEEISNTRFTPGRSYYLDFGSTDKNIGIEVLYTTAYGVVTEIHWTPGYFTIPESTTQIILRLKVDQYFTANGAIYNIGVCESALPLWKPQKMITFVDDDTTNIDYCDKYYKACKHNGIPGNYAVMGKRIDEIEGLASNLLSYEDDGFGMLIHAYNQSDSRGQWSPITHDFKLAYADLCKCVRTMNSHGFVDFKHWVIPSGYVWHDYELMARRLGMKSMISTSNEVYNVFSKFDPYYVKRVSFNPDDTDADKTLAYVKSIIDDFVNAPENGWLIVTTHFSKWGALTWDDTLDANGYPVGYERFNAMVQYAISAGCTPIQYQEGFSYTT